MEINTKRWDLILFAGQSNMAGRGEAQDAPDCEPCMGLEFRAVSAPFDLYPVREPFGAEENTPGGIDDGKRKSGSLVSAFIRTYYERTGCAVIAVSASKGGTSSAQWVDGYAGEAADRLKKARAYLAQRGIAPEHIYVLWSQGETDGDKDVSGEQYRRNFSLIWETLQEAGAEKCFVIQTGHFNYAAYPDGIKGISGQELDRRYEIIRKAQAEICGEGENGIPLVYLASGFGDCMGLMKDCFHYHQQAYNRVGREAAEAVCREKNRDKNLLCAKDGRRKGESMKDYNILDYGAKADGTTVNTEAIQAAINDCAGGRVVIPAGTFVSGALFLHSDMTLFLEEGAVLLGSGNLEDYPLCRYRFEGREQLCHASLINTEDIRSLKKDSPCYETGYLQGEERLRGIVIEGKGTIDGNGSLLKQRELAAGKGVRGRTLALRNVDGLVLRGVTVRQSPAWCVHVIFCRDVLLENVTICSKYAADGSSYNVVNGDGFDPDSCQNVTVRGCTIESQDDCIAIKSGRDMEGRKVGIPTENVLIEDCTFRYGFGVAVGSEMSGSVRHVLVQNCVFEETHSLASIKAPRGRGGVIEDIVYRNIRHSNRNTSQKDCRWFRGAVYIDQFYSHETFDTEHGEPVDEGTAVIRGITFENVDTETTAGNAVYLVGLPEQCLEDIRLSHVHAAGKTGMVAANIRGLKLEDVTVTAEEGETVTEKNVERA